MWYASYMTPTFRHFYGAAQKSLYKVRDIAWNEKHMTFIVALESLPQSNPHKFTPFWMINNTYIQNTFILSIVVIPIKAKMEVEKWLFYI